jgi:hypothetical protein
VKRPSWILPLPVLSLCACGNDYDYRVVIQDRPDIHDVVECPFEPTEDGWERSTCSPIFSARDEDAGPWERGAIEVFDIVERRVFGAAFYQMWYTAESASSGIQQIGYAISQDAVTWERHPWNPVVRATPFSGNPDEEGASVGCLAYDGLNGRWHLWYNGTSDNFGGTNLLHATSRDGVAWDKDYRVLDPLDGAGADLPSRVWACDALWEDGRFHFWAGGITSERTAGGLIVRDSVAYDVAYLSSVNGHSFDFAPELSLRHRASDSGAFDRGGVSRPSVFTWGDGSEADRYWMLYGGYGDTDYEIETGNDGGTTYRFFVEDQELGFASAQTAEGPFLRVQDDPVPLDTGDTQTLDNPRAFFVNGRVHVFYTDTWEDDAGQEFAGVGLGIAPFPREDSP